MLIVWTKTTGLSCFPATMVLCWPSCQPLTCFISVPSLSPLTDTSNLPTLYLTYLSTVSISDSSLPLSLFTYTNINICMHAHMLSLQMSPSMHRTLCSSWFISNQMIRYLLLAHFNLSFTHSCIHFHFCSLTHAVDNSLYLAGFSFICFPLFLSLSLFFFLCSILCAFSMTIYRWHCVVITWFAHLITLKCKREERGREREKVQEIRQTVQHYLTLAIKFIMSTGKWLT